MLTPQIKTIEVQGFRAFGADKQDADTNAPISVFWGPNSKGKTSLAEALEFASRAVMYQRRALVERPGDTQSGYFLGLHLAHVAAAQHGVGDPAAAIATSRAAIEAAPDSTVGLRELAKVCAAIAVDDRYSEFAAGAIDAGGCALRRLLEVRPTLGPAVRGFSEFAPLLAHPDFSDLARPLEDR